MLYYNFFFQHKEAQPGKSEKEKEAKEGSKPEEQEDPKGKDEEEEGSEDEESETDFSSADEQILTKAGRWHSGAARNCNRKLERVRLDFVGCAMLCYTVKFKISILSSF